MGASDRVRAVQCSFTEMKSTFVKLQNEIYEIAVF